MIVHNDYLQFRNDNYAKSFQKRTCAVKSIPDIKTVTQYSIALEEAIEELFCEWPCPKDPFILQLLQDAKENGRVPKKFISLPFENFSFAKKKVKKAYLAIKGGNINVFIKTETYSLRIYPDEIRYSTDYSISFPTPFYDGLKSLQGVLRQIEKIIISD